jgi:hypothetical protein
MKLKTTELQRSALDWAVAKCEFNEPHYEPDDWLVYVTERDSDDDGWIFKPSTDWSQGGPIIEREWLDVTPWPNESDEDLRWQCKQHDSIDCVAFGPTPLIAAMRCYLASKLGDEVDVPDELMEYEDPTDYVRMGWVDSRGRP